MESDLTRDIIKKERHHKTRTSVLLSTGKVTVMLLSVHWSDALSVDV